MVTDHLLIRRAAGELDAALRGARLRDVGFSDGGRFALFFGGKSGPRAVLADPFGTPPLLALVPDFEASLTAESAWARAAGAVLRGLTLLGVRARKGDRLIALDFGARSRFGVETASTLLLELVPRFGNVVLLKAETIVAAAKTFSAAENPGRPIEVGRPYQAPPLPQRTLDRAGFERLLGAAPAGWSKALSGYLPAVPRLVAASLAIEAASLGLAPAALADWFETRAGALDALDRNGPVWVYRLASGGEQPHVVELAQFTECAVSREPALLPVLARIMTADPAQRRGTGSDRLRLRLRRGLLRRIEALDAQIERLRERRGEVEHRDRLRRCGDALYAHAAEIPPGAHRFAPPTDPGLEIELDPELDAKANAAAYFARYRKAADAAPHLVRRGTELERDRAAAETLLWEVERGDAQALAEITADSGSARAPQRRRKVEAIPLDSGGRLYVGRSPRENVEITFTIARPDDLWFHARNVPGAHVVLVPPPGREATSEEILTAAAHAARNSRARGSAKVEVDYTRRKHVRKQRDAGPGMVWYTDFKTVAVAPGGD